jgi:hypothetical protein
MCFCGIIHTTKAKKTKPKTEDKTMKKTITEVETAIESRIAELEEEYELDIYDRNDIREEEYQKAGWRHDPFPEELEEEAEEEEEDWHYHSMEERLNEVGMSMRDFF